MVETKRREGKKTVYLFLKFACSNIMLSKITNYYFIYLNYNYYIYILIGNRLEVLKYHYTLDK